VIFVELLPDCGFAGLMVDRNDPMLAINSIHDLARREHRLLE
jgi:hypothetical protein